MDDFLPVKSRLPELEEERDLEPYQVYEAIGMSKQQYSGYRTGRKPMGVKAMKRIAEFFGVPMDDLVVWKKVSRTQGGKNQSRTKNHSDSGK